MAETYSDKAAHEAMKRLYPLSMAQDIRRRMGRDYDVLTAINVFVHFFMWVSLEA